MSRWLFAAFSIGVLLPAACLPDGEGTPSPPAALLDFLQPSRVEILSVAPGLAYFGLVNEEQPWSVHVLRVNLGRCEMGLRVLEAPVEGGEGEGRSRVSELVERAGAVVLAGVNGDFFTPEGSPVGTEVVDGQIRRVRARPALAWPPGGDPWMGTPSRRGDSILMLGWPVTQGAGSDGTQVLGGFPHLLRNGVRVGDLEVSDRPSFAAERHPRTVVGFDQEGDALWVVVVDGRQPQHSVGMTLPELTALMEALGVEDAVNLDGGGSSVMIVEGRVVSRPSDAEGERPVANGLGIVRDTAFCRLGG